MNYYERHLGDYARDTAHLSLLEHGVYTLLLDRYYATESGIPADQAHRLARARSRDERAAVDAVLEEFFALVDGVWTNRRVEEEIAKAATRIEAARSNGRRGGRPRKNPVGYEEKPNGFSLGSKSETQQKAHQTPDTRHQKDQKQERGSPAGSRLPADWSLPPEWREWAEAERPEVDPGHEAAKFADHWHAAAGAKGRKADWKATWRNWIRRADAPRGNARAGPNGQRPMGKQEQGLRALEAMKSGNRVAAGRTGDGIPEALLLGSGAYAGR